MAAIIGPGSEAELTNTDGGGSMNIKISSHFPICNASAKYFLFSDSNGKETLICQAASIFLLFRRFGTPTQKK